MASAFIVKSGRQLLEKCSLWERATASFWIQIIVYVPDHLCVVEMHAHGLSKQVRTAPIIPALN